ncbi:MAG: hypothetical protein ACYTEV_04130 [Planctomycetota bacterium]|jgi:hypothetical protein
MSRMFTLRRGSIIRLAVMAPILAGCIVGFRHVRLTHSEGRPAGAIPASAGAVDTVRVDATGTRVLVPVPPGFAALDPFRPDHARLWYSLSPRMPGCRVLATLVPATMIAADGALTTEAAPARVAFVGVPHALDDMPFDGGDFRVIRRRLRGPSDWPAAEDPAGTGPNAERVPPVRLGELMPAAARDHDVDHDDADEFRTLTAWDGGAASIGVVHTGSRVLAVAAVASLAAGESSSDLSAWCRDTGRWLHRSLRAAPTD